MLWWYLGLIRPKPPIYLYLKLGLSHKGRCREEVDGVFDYPTVVPNH